MTRFSILKRLPKKPLFALAVLAVALVAGGGASVKQADAAGEPRIRISFDWVKFRNIDDCSAGGVNCNVAEVYGFLHVDTAGNLFLGNTDGGSCEAAWNGGDATGPCRKTVVSGTKYNFAETSLCYNPYTGSCFVFSNELILNRYTPGSPIVLSISLKDFDPSIFDADDEICRPSNHVTPSPLNGPGIRDFVVPGFSLAQLQTLNHTIKLTYDNPSGHGGCELQVTFKRDF
jgi:hypothetical protein